MKESSCRECMGTGGIGRLETCEVCKGTGVDPLYVAPSPDAWLFTNEEGEPVATCRWDVSKHVLSEVRPLYLSPPKLAELQATIAQQAAEIKRLKLVEEVWKLQKDMPAAMIGALDEIERLKAEREVLIQELACFREARDFQL